MIIHHAHFSRLANSLSSTPKTMDFFNPQPKKYSQPKKKKGLKQKERKPTGELALFKEIFLERNGKCQITGRDVIFDPMSFMHILSKGAYPKFRLKKENILLVEPEIHYIYDNSDKETLLFEYPKAKIIYEIKEELKIEYYKPQPTV